MSHTSGPWQIDQEWLDPKWPDWRAVKIGNTYSSASGHIGEANARLIAAAPDMLAALKASMALGMKIYHNANTHEAPMDWARVKTLMDAAIAKAEGRS